MFGTLQKFCVLEFGNCIEYHWSFHIECFPLEKPNPKVEIMFSFQYLNKRTLLNAEQ